MKILQKLRSQFIPIFLNLFVLIIFLAHIKGVYHWNFVDELENYAYDVRMLLSLKKDQDPRIVIVDIDEKSLAEEGRWPWRRNRMAHLLDELFDYYHVSVVGFDVVFAEPDESSGLKILENLAKGEFAEIPLYKERLEGIKQVLDFDQIFADSMRNRKVVLGYYFNEYTDRAVKIINGILPNPILSKNELSGFRITTKNAIGYGANLELLQAHAASAGHFNPTIDADGVVRRVPLLYQFEGEYYEALSISIVRQLLETEKIDLVFGDSITGNYAEVEWLKMGRYKLPVDEFIQAMVPYRGKQNSFPYVSATDVLRGRVDLSILDNSIVLVGTTAPGLFDLRSTPVQSKYPGVEIHANLISGILDQRLKEIPAYVQGVEFITLLFIGLTITLLMPLLSPLYAAVITSMLLLVTVSFNYYVWEHINMVLPIALTVTSILVMFLLNMSYGFFIERRRKTELGGLFGQYIPSELVEEMSNDPTTYSLTAEDREMTVLFSDVRGFTTLSEGLNPKELSALMNEFLTPITQIIHENRGTIDKYMGDAVMAFWGAPIKDPDHALHALQAGLAMIERMYALRDEFLERGWPEIKVGVGINSGLMNVGNMGSEFRMAYTVLGDAVNLGSRLEGLTKQYGIDLMVGEDTKNIIQDYVFRKLDNVKVKGKAEPVEIFEPLGKVTEVSTEELDELRLYNEALKNYLSQDWRMATKRFHNLQNLYVDRELYKLYLERSNYFNNNPPGNDWDGVFTFTTK